MNQRLNAYTVELFIDRNTARVKEYHNYRRALAQAKLHIKHNTPNGAGEWPKARIVDPITGSFELYEVAEGHIVRTAWSF